MSTCLLTAALILYLALFTAIESIMDARRSVAWRED